ncbi:MAG: DinB family protein [Planctomycetes bacterium]|nr:DinB family protein [Planctomycetota bacterium]
MPIEIDPIVRNMTAHLEAFRAIYSAMTAEEARWRPSETEWSSLEILAHLVDEERDDFRTRVDLTLHRPDEPWPPIDPSGWVITRRYAERDLRETWEEFETERARSLAWIAGLEEPDWERSRLHPVAGELRAGDLMASWETHDVLHLRQVVRVRHRFLVARREPYSTRYAGEW